MGPCGFVCVRPACAGVRAADCDADEARCVPEGRDKGEKGETGRGVVKSESIKPCMILV